MFRTTSETEGDVVHVKLVTAPQVIHYWPFLGGKFVFGSLLPFLAPEFR